MSVKMYEKSWQNMNRKIISRYRHHAKRAAGNVRQPFSLSGAADSFEYAFSSLNRMLNVVIRMSG